MRALLDANVYISYLLLPSSDTPPISVVRAAFNGAYVLLLTEGVVAELRNKTVTKSYLGRRITPTQTERLINILDAVAEAIPELEEPFPSIGKDRDDDYLYAHAVIGGADYLVSGDKGVLDVRQIGDVQIVNPAEFLQILLRADQV